ncbi:hypothetical protein JCM10908_004602 [Rhodotorula pacifica]|uniref:uncharacterized protein n=1 Tax=Rhodotorula pacifica TaxID=1495444 RepID=UPI003175A245
MAAPPTRRVLISGAGIAGPVAAYWLGRAGVQTVLVERASSLRNSGQTLDVNGIARQVVERMGLTDAVRAACTGEKGTLFVDGDDRVRASLPAGFGPTNEYEIVRHALSQVFYDASKAETEYIFSESIKNFVETESEVLVEFASGAPSRPFDAVILADGIHSTTRSLVFGANDDAIQLKTLGAHAAYFSLPFKPEEDTLWSKWWVTTGRRWIWLRPTGSSNEGPAMLAALCSRDPAAQEELRGYRHLPQAEQKAMWARFFRGAGWKTDRILDGMAGAEDFYVQEMAQIIASRWSKGRVVLVGDAAYSPSPLSGMGTSCAITGAYILANELANRQQSVQEAFESYERLVRPYVQHHQAEAIGPSLADFLMPDTQWGLRRLYLVLSTVATVVNSPIRKLLTLLGGGVEDEKLTLPKYD